MIKKSFKQWQIDKNIIDACSSVDRFLTTKCQTLSLLQLILPIGWRISRQEQKLRYIERDLQIKQEDLNNVYMTIKNNKVHIHNFFQSEFNSDFLTIRLNVVITEFEQIRILC